MIILEIVLEIFAWMFVPFVGDDKKKKRLSKRDIAGAERKGAIRR